MKRAVYIALAALTAGATDPRLIMPFNGDPSALPPPTLVSNANSIATLFVPEPTASYTVSLWHRTVAPGNEFRFVSTMFSAESARATREGGPELPATREYAPITLSAGGTWSMSGLPQYDVPETLVGGEWDYGCFCVNILTPTPVTLTVAGTEKQVPASNTKQIFNILGSTSSRSVTLSAADPSAAIDFGIGPNPLIRYFGGTVEGEDWAYSMDWYTMSISNQLVCTQLGVWIENGEFVWKCKVRRLDGGVDIVAARIHPESVTNLVISKDARICVTWCGFLNEGYVYPATEVWGVRYAGRLLEDWELDRIFDIELAEIRRRHIMGE